MVTQTGKEDDYVQRISAGEGTLAESGRVDREVPEASSLPDLSASLPDLSPSSQRVSYLIRQRINLQRC